jgi:hypothetical protein
LGITRKDSSSDCGGRVGERQGEEEEEGEDDGAVSSESEGCSINSKSENSESLSMIQEEVSQCNIIYVTARWDVLPMI